MAQETKHSRGEKLGQLTAFGYRFAAYENVVVTTDNECRSKEIEMMTGTFEDFARFHKMLRAERKK